MSCDTPGGWRPGEESRGRDLYYAWVGSNVLSRPGASEVWKSSVDWMENMACMSNICLMSGAL